MNKDMLNRSGKQVGSREHTKIHRNIILAGIYRSPFDSGEYVCYACGKQLPLLGQWGWRGHLFCSKECSESIIWPESESIIWPEPK